MYSCDLNQIFHRTVMSKPREFAHLIRNKFGSADNINHIRAVEHAPSLIPPDDALVTSPATVSTLSAGTSNSLPGHGATSQVIIKHLQVLLDFSNKTMCVSVKSFTFVFLDYWTSRNSPGCQSRLGWWKIYVRRRV